MPARPLPDTAFGLPGYERPAGVHPPLDYPGYRSTALRHPREPLALLPHGLTEISGPVPPGGFRFDIRLQGERETVFFDV